MKSRLVLPALLLGCLAGSVQAQSVTVELELPAISSSQYKRPYVAVWVEKKGERRALDTIAVWHEDKKWLKDMRRWWRKSGRYSPDVDAVTGATRAPGTYQVSWEAEDAQGKALSGEYLICLESVREHGNRTLVKQAVTLGDGVQEYKVAAGEELGPVTIKVGE